MNISLDGVHNLCTAFFQQRVYFHVYRLEEDGSVLKEGGVRL